MRTFGIFICGLILTGCSVIEFSNKAPDRAATIVGAVEYAEPIISEIENATGVHIDSNVARRGENIAAGVAKGAQIVSAAVSAGSLIPGLQPLTVPAQGILTAITLLATASVAFFRKRAKTATTAVATMIKATEPLSGSGAAVKASLPSSEVGDLIEETYKAVKNG